ncbi:cold-regulated 413 inner membrane protein 1, chloroplastic isoform X2 [Cicer arietinum]|uniref:Cold-regulated 413 inner membrane protein 1, chloroplastic isoform X2 n=1 Tax=Cicer arietinum TaxID=3827 RepID=A0A1S2YGX6_CICAR|nr:cold-regulated 413 inner membrane protein 1, chloroplastic isoform X2 [Cicer arietinum]
MLPACSTTANPRTTFSHLNYRRDPSSSLFRSSPSSLSFNPLTLRSSFTHHYGIRTSVKSETSNRRRTSTGFRVLSYIAPSPFTTPNLQWISAVSSLVLILAKGTAVPKSFIVPLFALQAPAGVVAWIKGRYGLWSAFLALLVRLFFYIPGELELPFIALLLVIVAPYEALRLRDTKEGAAISLLIAVYLAFQHFSRTSLQKSFDQGSIVATLGVICITVSSLLLLI